MGYGLCVVGLGFFIHHSLLATHYSLFAICQSLFATHYSLLAIRYSLPFWLGRSLALQSFRQCGSTALQKRQIRLLRRATIQF
ncbi:hypothetical protein [Fervidibacter sp.]